MKNKIIKVNKNDLEDTIKLYNNDDFIVVDIDGQQIKNTREFFEIIEKKLSFPTACDDILARFADWITDLTWIERNKGICIVIKSFSELASGDTKFQDILIEEFEENILPYWEYDVVNIMVGGSVRNFVLIISE